MALATLTSTNVCFWSIMSRTTARRRRHPWHGRPPARSTSHGGVVAADRSAAAITVVRIRSWHGAAPGLLPETVQQRQPGWFEAASDQGLVISGAVLGGVGLPVPVLAPAQGILLHLTAQA